MALETKVILLAVTEIIRRSSSKREIFDAVAKLAGADGVAVEPLAPDEEEDGK